MRRCPNSRLLLKAKQLSDAAVCAQTRQRFAAHGIAPERLQLQGILASRNEHLATYHQVDIALDTFPYPGVTTSVEALWMGVPVLSLQGDRFLSCTASSIAHNAGLPEWIAAGQDDYVRQGGGIRIRSAQTGRAARRNCAHRCWPRRCSMRRALPGTSRKRCGGCGSVTRNDRHETRQTETVQLRQRQALCAMLRTACLHQNEINALIALYNTRRYAELESRARLLSERYPDFGFGWQLLGGALQMQGKDALQAFHKTAQLLPEDAVAHYNLGVAQKSAGRLDEAVASYRRAVSLKPDYVEAHYNLGNALKSLGQQENAAQSYRRAVQLRPDHAEAHYSLGIVLQNLDQLDGAVASYRRALQLKPDNAEACYNLGSILQEQGKLVEAEASYRRVLELEPDHAEAHHNLGIILQHFGRIDDAVASYRRALQLMPDSLETQTILLLTINYAAGMSGADYLTEARQYGRMAAGKVSGAFLDLAVRRPLGTPAGRAGVRGLAQTFGGVLSGRPAGTS